MNIRLLMLPVLSMLIWTNAQAQNDPLGGQDTMILENERIIDVIESEKPFFNPPSRQVQKPETGSFFYESIDYFMMTDYQPRPPQVRPLERERQPDYNDNMIKLGLGRYLTPSLQLYLNSGENRYAQYGLEFSHLSAHNDEIEYRKFREDFGTVYGSYQNKTNQLDGHLHVYNTQYFNYADTSAISSVESFEDSLRMSFTHVELAGALKSLDDPNLLYRYDLGGKLRLHQDKRDNSEFHVILNPKGKLIFTDIVSLHADLDFTYTKADINGISQNRTFFGLKPLLSVQTDAFRAKGGIIFNAYNNDVDSSSQSNFGPILEAEYELFPESLILMGGYTSGMTYNHYYGFIEENRFIGRQIGIQPTIEKFNIYGGIKGNAAQRVNYSAKVYLKKLEQAPVYTIPIDGAYFDVAYDSAVNVLGIHGEVNFLLSEAIRFGGAVNYNNYSTETFEKYFQLAPLKVELFGSYSWNDQLFAKASASFLSKTPMTQDAGEDIIYRDPLLLLNLSADYRILPNFSVFLNINNLLNTSYQRWYNYEERPVDILGGISFMF